MKPKKIFIWAVSIGALLLFISGIINMTNLNKEDIALNETTENITEISSITADSNGEVEDECLNEWKEYNEYVNKQIDTASSNLTDKDTHYILKDVLGYIEVYYLDDNNEQYLYKKTTIPTTYLSQEDIEDLKIGIEVTGIEALNKMLEDFE